MGLEDSNALKRKQVIEEVIAEGYAPYGYVNGRETCINIAAERLGISRAALGMWVLKQSLLASAGRQNYFPDISKYQGPPLRNRDIRNELPSTVPSMQGRPEAEISRSESFRSELISLVTSSKYPLVNVDAITVDSPTVRSFSSADGTYRERSGTPRTYLSDTLKVAPVHEFHGTKFIFTGAQNDTAVHEGFWQNLTAYADEIGAQIVVGPWTYETQWWAENAPLARVYDPRIKDYLCFGQMRIGDNFIFAGEMNTLPTASKPISDLVTYSRGKWAVFPHAKRQLKSVPSTDPNVQAHQVMTTGACTIPKVIPRKAGVKSLFHHVIGAVIVEFDHVGDIFCRHLSADHDGSFYDLDAFVSEGKISYGHNISALVCGDIHTRKLSRLNSMATFGFDLQGSTAVYQNSIVDALKPNHIMLHDIFDNEARNHHHVNDNAYSFEMSYRKRDSVEDEILQVGAFLERIKETGSKIVVVESNHDIALDRYVREGRYRNDGMNIPLGLKLEQLYIEFRRVQADALERGETPPTYSLLEEALRLMIPQSVSGVKWVHDGNSFLIDRIECGHHGFRGANGAKGTVAGFARMGRKMNIGDKHSPEIDEGVYVAGAMNLRHGYNKGPSSWAVSHIVQYANGKRTIVTLQNGKWRAEKPRVSMTAAA